TDRHAEPVQQGRLNPARLFRRFAHAIIGALRKSSKLASTQAGGFAAISDTALNKAISGSIFAEPLACLVIRIALPLGSTRALPQHQFIIGWAACSIPPSASF